MKSTVQTLLLLFTAGLSAASWCPAVAQTANEKLPTPSAAFAPTAVPALVPYSGVALGSDGKPLTGEAVITFLVFKDDQGGDPLFAETQNVTLDAAGRYKVQLGASLSSGLPTDLFANGDARWLEVQISGQTPQPRALLVSVPYALKAADASTLGGLPASAFVLAGSQTATNATAPALATTARPDATTATSTAVTTTGGATGNLAVFSGASAIANSNVFEDATGVGIGTTTPAATLDVNGAVDLRGIAVLFPKATATVTAGANSFPLTLSASGYNSTTKAAVMPNFAWQAEPTGNDTSAPSATLNLLSSTGTAAAKETGLYVNSNGTVHFAAGQTFPGTGVGTIAGVTAGNGLAGGGTSGNVTLNVDTTKVPLLNASNSFTGNQAINGSLTSTGNIIATGQLIGSSETLSHGLSAGGILIPANGASTSAQGANSYPLDLEASSYSYSTGPYTADFRWQAESGNVTSGASTPSLNLLYGSSASAPVETGFSVTPSGTLSAASLNVGPPPLGPYGIGTVLPTGAIGAQQVQVTVPAGTIATPALVVQADDDSLSRHAPQQLVIQGSAMPGQQLLIGYLSGYSSKTETTGGYASLQATWTGNLNTPLLLQPNGGCVCIRINGDDAIVNNSIEGQTTPLLIGQGQGAAVADAWYVYSSRRWKNNIQTLPDALSKIEKLRGVSYDLKATGKHEVGLIAEEVGAVVPEVVQWEANGKDARGVDYSRLTALLIEATKQQQAEFEKAMRLIKSQQAQIHKQAASMKALSAQVRTANESLQKAKQQWIAPQGAPSTAALVASR